jgi:OOP family OmpA-OmpF porin
MLLNVRIHFRDFIMFKKIVAAAALAMLAGSSYAAPTDGVYVGLDVGSTKIDDLDGSKASVGGFVGYSFNENYAVEAAYRHLGTWTISNVDLKATQTALSLVGTLPLNQQFNIFARVGYNRVNAEASYQGVSVNESNNGSFYGFGVGYNFSTNVAARLEAQKPESDVTNVNVAVIYKF